MEGSVDHGRSYSFTEKKVSPVPMVFRKTIQTAKAVAWARLYVTAMGIYELELDGKKLGTQYFAPGFTSYASQLQYQTYDVTDLLTGSNELTATVAGGPQEPRYRRPSGAAGRASHPLHRRHGRGHWHGHFVAGHRERPRQDGRPVRR